MNLGRRLGASCNQCEHAPPMIAIMATDDCEQLQLCGRDDSPWYPTLRLFHQPAPGEWAPVVDQLREALLRRSSTAGG